MTRSAPLSKPVSPLHCQLLDLPRGFHVVRYDHPVFTVPRCDMHCNYELGIVLRGSCRRFCDHDHSDLEPGQVWFCDMWQPHGFQALSPCSVIVATCSPDILNQCATESLPGSVWTGPFSVSFKARPQTPRGKLKIALRKFKQMHKHYCSDSVYGPQYARLVFQEILLDYIALGPSEPAPAGHIHEISIVNSAMQYVMGHPQYCTLAEACGHLNVHPKTLTRYFMKYLHMSFSEFHLRHRLTCVAQQLKTSQQPIKHLAHVFGFTDAGHLCRTFDRYYRCTPAQYRRHSKA